jgi:cellulose synthase/poly-beta-1,6-N-acetylglucosamine synthase-like glycosyltransferase
MVIDITKCRYQEGYLPPAESGLFHPFFATANAAFRRTALQRAGEFDTACVTGEDLDLCVRVARSGFEMWHQPDARVVHHDRKTVGAVLKQFYYYGYAHAYLFRKHLPSRRLQVYRYRPADGSKTAVAVRCVLDVPSPVYAMVYVGAYQILHLALLGALIFALMALPLATWIAVSIAVVSAASYCRLTFEMRRPFQSLALCGLWYLVHGAYSLGGFLGGLKHGVFFIEAASRRPRGARAQESS